MSAFSFAAILLGVPHPDTAQTAPARTRARFEPALDAGGQPIPSYYFATIRHAVERLGVIPFKLRHNR